METSDPKHAVDIELAKRQMNQKDLAKLVGRNETALSRTLSTNRFFDNRSMWPEILDALNLEVIIRPKQP